MVIIFHHDELSGWEVSAVKQWVKVNVESVNSQLFPSTFPPVHQKEEKTEEEEANVITGAVLDDVQNAEDIWHVGNLRYEVDDDNQPAPDDLEGDDRGARYAVKQE